MRFQRIEPNEHYRTLHLLSEEGTWEFGLDLQPSGLRLRMGRAGRPPKVLDFCLGTDSSLYAPVVLEILQRLDRVIETSNEEEIDAHFPWAGTRPDLNIHLEPLLRESQMIPADDRCRTPDDRFL